MKTIGIIGGGQLGKMMILDGKRLDTRFVILDPTENCPAHSIADEHIIAAFDDADGIKRLAAMSDVVTYEFEHISQPALAALEQEGHLVYPSSRTLYLIQDKYRQKEWLRDNGLPIPDFQQIDSLEALREAAKRQGYPLILKTCTGGYDGKGNAVIKSEEDLETAYQSLGGGQLPLMVEEYIPFEKEVSILACRSTLKTTAVFPVAENVHKDSILDETFVPAAIAEDTVKEAMEIATRCLEIFDAVGMLCIELFVTRDGHVLINELAPRPHNSGHYTIEGCYTSQYEQHIRGILGLPLGNSSLIRPAAMKNIIGDKAGDARLAGLFAAYKNPDAKIHIYGKEKVAKGRKMGHITATAATVQEALKQVRKAHEELYFESADDEKKCQIKEEDR